MRIDTKILGLINQLEDEYKIRFTHLRILKQGGQAYNTLKGITGFCFLEKVSDEEVLKFLETTYLRAQTRKLTGEPSSSTRKELPKQEPPDTTKVPEQPSLF